MFNILSKQVCHNKTKKHFAKRKKNCLDPCKRVHKIQNITKMLLGIDEKNWKSGIDVTYKNSVGNSWRNLTQRSNIDRTRRSFRFNACLISWNGTLKIK